MDYFKKIGLVFVLIGYSFAYGQGAREELKTVLDTYSALEHFSVDAEYKSYKTHASLEVEETAIAQYRRDGNKLRTNNMGMEYIQNEKHALVIDNTNKVILLANSKGIPEGLLGIEKTLKTFEKVKKTGETATTTSYQISFKQGVSEYHKAIYVVYKSTNLLKRVTLFYATDYAVNTQGNPKMKKPKVSISYKNYKIGASFKLDKNEFTISKHFLSMTGNVKLKEKYKTYEFYDKRVK
jgi:hypothetical protein